MATEFFEKSHALFGRGNRLSVFAAIAGWSTSAFTTSELAARLALTTGEVAKELAPLVQVGLLEALPRRGTRPYRRIESGFWNGCAALLDEWRSSAPTSSGTRVVPMRRYRGAAPEASPTTRRDKGDVVEPVSDHANALLSAASASDVDDRRERRPAGPER